MTRIRFDGSEEHLNLSRLDATPRRTGEPYARPAPGSIGEGGQQGVERGFDPGPTGLVEAHAADAGAGAAAEGEVLDRGQQTA
jgi:hypothetical protein